MSTPSDSSPEDELVPPPYEPGSTQPTGSRLLRRSKSDRVIAGVAGGLGRYFGIDPVLLRIAMVVLTIAGGSGILLYLIGWIAIPEEQPGDNLGPAHPSGANTARMIIGVLLILAGGAILLDRVTDLGRFFWPAVVILLGAAVLFGGVTGKRS